MQAAHFVIAVPSHDVVPVDFAFDLARLTSYTTAAVPDGVIVGLMGLKATYIHAARNDLIEAAIVAGATHILWLDSDMRFPSSTLMHLARRNKPVVGCNYAQRVVDPKYVAIKEVGKPGVRCATTAESEGLEEVEALGFGCLLLRLDALEGMPDPNEVPWFQNVYLGDGEWMGEDVHFCKLLREAGHKIYVDHDLSKHVRHIGSFEYDLSMVEG